MEALLKEHERLEKTGNLENGIEHVQTIIDQLKNAREAVASNPDSASLTMAKLHMSVKSSFEKVNDDLKGIHTGITKYGKALDKKFKDQMTPTADNDALSTQQPLINRAIAMHLLREGHFDVATIFINEANAQTNTPTPSNATEPFKQPQKGREAWDTDFSPNNAFKSTALQVQFAEMYHILSELRTRQNLAPAIDWARAHSEVLEARGSNLQFDLCSLQYASLFLSHPENGPLAAHRYAMETFPSFPSRYFSQIKALLGALAFAPDIAKSPYAALFSITTDNDIINSAAAAFTSEFCALMSLSSASPLLTAVTAGCIALPTLLKLSQIQATHRTSWTTASELPVEVPLPPQYHFHSVFVCPVSKEQSTDENPPMMMPCGHVVALESLDKLSKGGKFKCPYCPNESHPNQATKVYL